MSATTFVALIGRIVLGFLSDYVDRRFLAAGGVAIQGLALVLVATVSSPGGLLIGSMAFGLGVGVLITLPPLLTHEQFGTSSFGTIFAMVNGTMQIGVAVGPGLVGILRDRWGGYGRPLCVLAAIDGLAMVLILAGWAYARRDEQRQKGEQQQNPTPMKSAAQRSESVVETKVT